MALPWSLDASTKRAIAESFAAGVAARDIASHYGVSHVTVYKIAKDHGVRKECYGRPHGGLPDTAPKIAPPPVDSGTITDLADRGHSEQQIAAKLRVPYAEVRTALGHATSR